MSETQNTQTINTLIVLRNDHGQDIKFGTQDSNVILQPGELGVHYLDNGNVVVKMGDGTTKWEKLKQVEGVFEEDLTLTYNFGRHKTSNGSVNAGGRGMTTSEWLRHALSEIVNPKITQPSTSLVPYCYLEGSNTRLTATQNTSSVEIGTKIAKLEWDGSFSGGSYTDPADPNNKQTFGTVENGTGTKTKDTGLGSSHLDWLTSNSVNDSTSTSLDGSFSLSSGEYIQVDTIGAKKYATLTQKANYKKTAADAVRTPLNNVGAPYEDGTIDVSNPAEGYKFTKDALVYLSGYRNSWYYVGEDCTSDIDSDFIRTYGTPKNANTTNFGTITIPKGTKRVVIAVPGSHTLQKVVDVDGMGLAIHDLTVQPQVIGFDTETIQIEGANGFEADDYTIFVYENSNGVAATKYTFTIS